MLNFVSRTDSKNTFRTKCSCTRCTQNGQQYTTTHTHIHATSYECMDIVIDDDDGKKDHFSKHYAITCLRTCTCTMISAKREEEKKNASQCPCSNLELGFVFRRIFTNEMLRFLIFQRHTCRWSYKAFENSCQLGYLVRVTA